MNKKRIAILALALFAALGAAFMAKKMLNGKNQVAQKSAEPQIEVVQVLVAADEIHAGQVIEEGAVKWQKWPKSALSSKYISDDVSPDGVEEATGSTARATFTKGEPIIQSKLVKAGGSGYMSAILPAGMRAVSIKISPETGAGGFILPNDRVDVVLTKSENGRGSRGQNFTNDTILSNVRVLAIDQSDPQKDDEGKVVIGKTATLELTQPHAELLALAESLGELTLSLRSIQDFKMSGQGGQGPVANADFNQVGTSQKGTVKVLRYGVATTASGN